MDERRGKGKKSALRYHIIDLQIWGFYAYSQRILPAKRYYFDHGRPHWI